MPFRPGPFFGFFWQFWPKNPKNRGLAYMAGSVTPPYSAKEAHLGGGGSRACVRCQRKASELLGNPNNVLDFLNREEASGQKFVPEKETEGTFSGQFLTPFFVRPLSENSFKAKNPSLFAKIRPKGGCAIPARAVFWGFLEKNAKKGHFSRLSLYGGANRPAEGAHLGGGGSRACVRCQRVGDERVRRSVTLSYTLEEAAGQKFVPKTDRRDCFLANF